MFVVKMYFFKILWYTAIEIKDETIWITQKAMAELFDVKVPAISKHLKNIFEDGELDEQVVISKMEIATQHGAIPGKMQNSATNVLKEIEGRQ